MRAAYRVLAYLVALEVVVQAAVIAYAVFGESKFISEGNAVTKQLVESQSADFDGVIGYPLHGINGQMIVPAIAVLLLIASFFAKVPQGIMWAGIVVVLVALQILLGGLGHDVPFLGLLHGLNALAIFTCAVLAARKASTPAGVAPAGRTSVA